jgi:hypothetical protein
MNLDKFRRSLASDSPPEEPTYSVGGGVEQLKVLPQLAGKGTVIENFILVLAQAARFQEEALPLFSGIVSDPTLLKAQQVTMRKAGKGPHLSQRAIAQYLEAEKRARRVHPDLDSELTASLLLRSSFGRVFEERFSGRASGAEAARETRSLIIASSRPSGRPDTSKLAEEGASTVSSRIFCILKRTATLQVVSAQQGCLPATGRPKILLTPSQTGDAVSYSRR